MSYTFPAQVAWNVNGSTPVPNVSFQVYAVADTTFSTPLAITDTNGNPLAGNILSSGRFGVFPQFMQAGNATVVITDAAHVYAWTLNCIPSDASTAAFINNGGSATAAALSATYVPQSAKGAASGVATLDSGSKVPVGQVPDLSANYVKRGEVVINAADYLTGGATDTVAINNAITAAYNSYVATGSPVTVFVPPKTGGWSIVRRTVGTSQGGGIKLRRGVDLMGQRTKLVLADNCHFIYAISPTNTGITITANTLSTDTTLTVADSTGIAVGNDVLIRIGQAAYDAAEPDWYPIAKVTAVTPTSVTIDRPVGYALNAASVTNTANRSINVITELLEGNVIDGFEMINPMTGGANAECGITVGITRNITIRNVTSQDAGAGIVCTQFSTNVTIDNPYIRSAVAQNGQASKGRCFNFAESQGVVVRNAYGQNFDNSFVTSEAGSTGVVFESPRIVNNSATRAASKSLFEILGKGTLVADSPTFTGNSCVINNTSQASTRNPTFRMSTMPIVNDLTQMMGTVQVGDSTYRDIRKVSFSFPLPPSTSNKLIPLGNGLIRRFRVYASGTTGITAFGVGNTTSGAQAMNATAGQWVEVPLAKGLGSGYPVNNYDAKQIYFTTDATMPAGNYAIVEAEIQVPDGDTGVVPAPTFDLARTAVPTDGLILTADSTKPAGITWATGGAPSAHAATHRAGGTDDLLLYGAHSVSTLIEPWPRWTVQGKITVSNGTVVFSYFTPDHAATISNLTIHAGSTATVGATLVRMGLFTVDGSGNLTLVARTDSDTTILATANGGNTRALSVTGGFPSSYALVAGQRYAFGIIVVGATTAGQYFGINSTATLLYNTSPRMAAGLSGQSDLPTTQITVGSLGQHGAPPYIAGT